MENDLKCTVCSTPIIGVASKKYCSTKCRNRADYMSRTEKKKTQDAREYHDRKIEQELFQIDMKIDQMLQRRRELKRKIR